jgi:hypothetical protein
MAPFAKAFGVSRSGAPNAKRAEVVVTVGCLGADVGICRHDSHADGMLPKFGGELSRKALLRHNSLLEWRAYFPPDL